MAIFLPFLGNGCRKKVRKLKIKKVDDKPMVIHTKKKAKIHTYEYSGQQVHTARLLGNRLAIM